MKLPVSEVTLIATTLEEEDPDNKYQYEWTSLHQPDGSTAVKHQNEAQLHLEKLSEGTYEFRVINQIRIMLIKMKQYFIG